MTDKVKRRLTTVLCADVQGYSRLMEADEAGTLAELRRRRTAMTQLVARHDGRIVNTWGDAVIAEFASVVEAVQCAIEIQQEVSREEAAPSQTGRMQFRIGINLGDVMIDGDDIYGDGVNIASRLQEIAEPGGIVISNPVYEQVRNKLSVGFDNLGPQQMKNVAPVVSYRVALVGGDGPARPAAMPPLEQVTPGVQGGFQRPGWVGFIQDGFAKLPRSVAAALVAAGFLALINLLTNPHRIWFHWPVMVLLFVGAMRMLRGGRGSDR